MPRDLRRFTSLLGQRAGTPRESSASSASTEPSHASHSSHLRNLASLLVVSAVIGMAALGFHALAATRAPAQTPLTKAAATATSPTASAPKNQWMAAASLGTAVAPILAPSNPHVLYQVSSPSSPLRRSTDQGKTWQSTALPERLASGVNLYVSPLNADTIFLSARYLSPPQDGAHCIETPENVPLAAGYDCVAQWVSRDGGAHWVTPRLPLGAPLADLAPPFWSGAPEFVQAQGQSLFGALYCHQPLCGNTGYRIVRSADGGVSWQFADSVIAAGHHYVCDLAPVASDTTIFAVSADISCTAALAGMTPSGSASFLLWRSDDAGQHWSQVGMLPAGVGGHLLVEQAPTGAQPLLYGGMSTSTDGGVTWQAAPHAGLPANAHTQVIGVRHDGSLLVGTIPINTVAGQPVSETIYRWRAGDASWHQVGLPLPSFVTSFTATTDAIGQETLWLTLPIGPFSATSGGQLPAPASYRIESLFD